MVKRVIIVEVIGGEGTDHGEEGMGLEAHACRMDNREGDVAWKVMDIIEFLWKSIIVVVIIVRRWLKKQLL